MLNKTAEEATLSSINMYKGVWSRAYNKQIIYELTLAALENVDNTESDTKKAAQKIQDLKQKISQEKFDKTTYKSEIEILERQTWNKNLTDQSEDSVANLKEAPKKNEQNKSTRLKNKLAYV